MTDSSVLPDILFLYHEPAWEPRAETVRESIDAIQKDSRYMLWALNTEHALPPRFSSLRFRVILFHYSLFVPDYKIPPALDAWLMQSGDSYKVAFFQDEHHYCQQRFAFINRHRIQAVYSMGDAAFIEKTYRRHTTVETVRTGLTGYVGPDLASIAKQLHIDDRQRPIDIGYRGRRSALVTGKAGEEKWKIAETFLQKNPDPTLRLDIEWEEKDRLYGNQWHRFLSRCRGCLGVESGSSFVDIDDHVRLQAEDLLRQHPGLSIEKQYERLLKDKDGQWSYRTISPRHFEAAAHRICQILFEGSYSGILVPMKHYLPLRKDFSNLADVVKQFKDETLRRQITDQAYQDLIASGRYDYRVFVQELDELLSQHAQLRPRHPVDTRIQLIFQEQSDRTTRLLKTAGGMIKTQLRRLPGWSTIRDVGRYILRRKTV